MVSEGVREIIAWAGGNAVLDHRLTTPLAGHESRRRRAIVRLSTGPRGEDLSALLLRAERDDTLLEPALSALADLDRRCVWASYAALNRPAA